MKRDAKKGPVHLCAFYTENFLPLKNYFEESLRLIHDEGLSVEIERIPDDDTCGKQVEKWERAMRLKVKKIIEYVQKYRGEEILFSDIDIIFFRKISPLTRTMLNGHDIVFQKEFLGPGNKDVNTGLMAMWCNDATLDFWRTVAAAAHKDAFFNDQRIVNDFLREKSIPIRWTFFPDTISATTHRGLRPSPWITSFHATCSINMNKKIEMLEAVRKVVRSPAHYYVLELLTLLKRVVRYAYRLIPRRRG
ncbi:MAG: putative nucleotide-diphospho-sugar transferase [Candidatus Omnitrophota bacterium]